jgi:hypothetical protein
MSYTRFELAIVDLARRGTRLTVANVAAHLRMEPSKAEAWLDKMATEGRLDLEVDEDEGVVFYRVRGLGSEPRWQEPPPRTWSSPSYAPVAMTGWTAPGPVVKPQKNALLAAAFGLVLPGLGLVYAAPLSAVAIASIVTLCAVKMAGALPLVGMLLKSVVLGVAALASAVLGVLYTRQYNLTGKRTHLDHKQVADRVWQSARL